jgi:flavin reductase (DIM6/NTAB) family NADH-FMN oxidoreductase RutF
VDEALAEPMNVCAIDFPPGESELEAAGLTIEPSVQVKAPRIAQSPVSLECREHTTLSIGRNRIVLGEVLHLHIRDELVDAEKMHVHSEKMHAIGRMHGAGGYARTDDIFHIPRISHEEWTEQQNK